jgi:transmembrane sensor
METEMASSRQIERAAAAWLARRDAGQWTHSDQAELETWLAASTARRVAWIRLEAAWRQSGRLKALGAGVAVGTVPVRGRWTQSPPYGMRDVLPESAPLQPEAAHGPGSPQAPDPIDPASLRFAPRQRREPRRNGFATAVAAAVLVAAVALGWRYYPTAEPMAYRTAIGNVESMSLADGSEATLSSDSRIVVALSRRERHVDLQQGEAFFHAAKDPGRPFVVSAGGYRVVAVGTRFSVRRDGTDLRVVVTEGLVRLESAPGNGRDRPVTLLPAGSIATTSPSGTLVRTGPVEQAEQYLSWRDGFLSFRDTPLSAAAAEFNRYNARKIVIGDPAVADMRVGGNFRWSNTEAFVRLLEQGFPVRAEQRGDAIVLHAQ